MTDQQLQTANPNHPIPIEVQLKMQTNIFTDLMDCFSQCFINHNWEFVCHPKANSYFSLRDIDSDLDLKCKVLEWLSRDACTSNHFGKRANIECWKYHRDGINKCLGTNFSHEEMIEIYTYLGNSVNRNKTIQFIESGYDMTILKEDEVAK